MAEFSHYADIMAIPFWVVGVLYFDSIKKRNITENILLFFTICGLVFDTLFSIAYLKSKILNS